MYEVSSCYSLFVRERHFQLCRVTISHRGRVTHICVSKICHHWFRQWLGAWSAPSHYLNQYSNIVNSNLRKKLGRNLKQISYTLIQENAFWNVSEMAAILSRHQCDNAPVTFVIYAMRCYIVGTKPSPHPAERANESIEYDIVVAVIVDQVFWHTSWSPLAQVMDCRVCSTKTLHKPMVMYYQLGLLEQISMKIESKYSNFHFKKCIEKCRLPDVAHIAGR